MQLRKMSLDEVEEENYELIAIHCSVEEYKMAYLLNKNLKLQLKRNRKDIDFKHPEIQAFYALYTFNDAVNYRTYYLVSNKFKGLSEKIGKPGSLFLEKEVNPFVAYLIPEYKKVDFFFKIEEDVENHSINKILNTITHISQVITAYRVDVMQLKSKQNLIFE